ncbi:hypothetical protein V1Y59_01425 [Gordonia sp. PKS22-38]|uniref:DUF6891 domain-containing protein n=1 Tax=Gordonia prachuapensis TaxID=3115651 RepID=A0ABU7MN10_9ACTN|nr:hypothetical protein [Gordonia sp. PKS22-38]
MRAASLTDLRQMIRPRLVAGFHELGELESDARDWAEDTGGSPDEAVAAVQDMWAVRAAEETDWPDTGDYGRLRAAFDELDDIGVLARMNYACCARCATALIDEERTPAPDRADWYKFREWAYVFFDEQDAEHLADDEPLLHLTYSGFRPHESLPDSVLDAMSDGDADAEHLAYEQTETLLAEQIVDVLRRHDLDVEWSGSRFDAIGVRITAWRKPLPQNAMS